MVSDFILRVPEIMLQFAAAVYLLTALVTFADGVASIRRGNRIAGSVIVFFLAVLWPLVSAAVLIESSLSQHLVIAVPDDDEDLDEKSA
jgi:hypothetical protein